MNELGCIFSLQELNLRPLTSIFPPALKKIHGIYSQIYFFRKVLIIIKCIYHPVNPNRFTFILIRIMYFMIIHSVMIKHVIIIRYQAVNYFVYYNGARAPSNRINLDKMDCQIRLTCQSNT